MSSKNRRQFDRVRYRLSCELHHSGRRHSGMVLDISASGLFVRTSTGTAPKDPGTEVRVVINDPNGEPFELLARLARANVVRRELVTAADGGFGLEVTSAPEQFYKLVRAVT